MEHNKMLANQKRCLEKILHSESDKCAKLEGRVNAVNEELATKERRWRETEAEMQNTTTTLKERLQKEIKKKSMIVSPQPRCQCSHSL